MRLPIFKSGTQCSLFSGDLFLSASLKVLLELCIPVKARLFSLLQDVLILEFNFRPMLRKIVKYVCHLMIRQIEPFLN